MSFPEPQMIGVNGVDLEVFCAGSPDDPAVVMCHGWPEHAYSWRHQVAPLVNAGYHVIVPNQRGYGESSRPDSVSDYDISHLTDDLAGLLDHFGHAQATFAGHDWGAIIVWAMALMQPDRVSKVINLSVPFMERGTTEWVGFWEQHLGGDFYIVHFNRQPGVADAAFDRNPEALLRNMYRTGDWDAERPDLGPGMPLINLAQPGIEMPGILMMSDEELAVFVDAFKSSGFTGGINYYRNFSRNWKILGSYEQIVRQPTLMIYGTYDSVPKSERLSQFVPDVEVHELPCGHWIQQERPGQTTAIMLDWLNRHR